MDERNTFAWDDEGYEFEGDALAVDAENEHVASDNEPKPIFRRPAQVEIIEIDSDCDSDCDDDGDDAAAAAEMKGEAQCEYDEREVRAALARFGHTQLRGLQEPAIRSVFGGYDTVVLLPTGGGKSLCFQLPALMLPGLVLVISPLLALIQDQVQALQQRGIRVAMLCSVVSYRDKEKTHSQLLRDAYDPHHPDRIELLYTTPETLGTEALQTVLSLMYEQRALSMVAIDEAHCISSWGHDFRPAYLKLKAVREQFPLVPIMALTATATERVREDIRRELLLRDDAQILTGDFNRPNISYTTMAKNSSGNSTEALYQFIKRCHYQSVGIVYVHRRVDTEALVLALRKKDPNLHIAPYHAKIQLKQREETLIDWLSGKVNIICATIAFGMGIDHPAVRFVVHWNIPKSLENLYQEAGRAGRDGHPSHHVLMYCHEEYDRFRSIMMMTEAEIHDKAARGKIPDPWPHLARLSESLKKLELVMKWATSPTCRRQRVLAYFGQSIATEQCNSTCDVCSLACRFDQLQPLESHRPSRMMVHAQVQALVASQSSQRVIEPTAAASIVRPVPVPRPVPPPRPAPSRDSVYGQFSGTSQARAVQPMTRSARSQPVGTGRVPSRPTPSGALSIRDYMAATEHARTAFVSSWRPTEDARDQFSDSDDEDGDGGEEELDDVKWVKTESKPPAPRPYDHLLPAWSPSALEPRVKRPRREAAAIPEIIEIDSD